MMNKLMLLIVLCVSAMFISCYKIPPRSDAETVNNKSVTESQVLVVEYENWSVVKSPSGRCYEVLRFSNTSHTLSAGYGYMGLGNEVDCDDPTKPIEPDDGGENDE